MPEPTADTPATPDAAQTPDETPSNSADVGDEAALGEPGKKALDAMKAERNEAKRQAATLQAQIDAINRANESAVEKATREANEYKEAATKATADALRYRIAAKHSISEEDAELFLTGTDEATITRQAARLAERAPATSAGPRPDLTQGGNPGDRTSDKATVFADFLNRTS